MPIARYDAFFREFVADFRQLTDGLRTLTGGSGSIPLQIFHDLSAGVFTVMVGAERIDQEFETDAGNSYANAEAFLARRPGAPQTVVAWRAAVDAIEAARPAFETATLEALNAGATTWSLTPETDPDTGITTNHYTLPNAVSNPIGNAWRGDARVIAFRDALIAAGG